MLKCFRLVLLAALVATSGCELATEKVWGKDRLYNERLTGFYLSEQMDWLIVSGNLYSYVFEIEPDFGKALMLSRSVEMRNWISAFELTGDNEVNGEITLRVDHIPDEMQSSLEAAGFVEGALRGTQLSGKRYVQEGSVPDYLLESDIYVRVNGYPNDESTLDRLQATPVAVAKDAAFLGLVTFFFGSVIVVALPLTILTGPM